MTIHIKKGLCARCKMAVIKDMKQLVPGFDLGQADIKEDSSIEQRDQIKTNLLKSDLELIDDIKTLLIERIKNIILDLVYHSEEPLPINLSLHLSQRLNHNYTYMANIFSKAEGYSIEKFLIKHKIERVKQLLNCNDLSLTEIAYQMHYSSVAHLSNQFKKATGDTATHYRHLKVQRTGMLEEI